MKRFIFIAGLVGIFTFGYAQKKIPFLKPNTLQFEFAGNYGLFSMGLGKSYMGGNITSSLNIGYLPKQINGVKVKSIAWKNAFNICDFHIKNNYLLYSGLSLVYYDTNNTYTNYPDYFPESYYDFPSSIHVTPFIGATIRSGREKNGKYLFFFEFSTVDYYLRDLFKNHNINFFDLWNL